jgi:hypothetical protein
LLGLVQTATENKRVCAAFLRELQERGFRTPGGLLVVLDGSKGLRAAVRDVFGEVPVQRCQWHKRENVVSYLPKGEQPAWRRQLQAAYAQPSHADAQRALQRLRRELALRNESAARSLEEGLDETPRCPHPQAPSPPLDRHWLAHLTTELGMMTGLLISLSTNTLTDPATAETISSPQFATPGLGPTRTCTRKLHLAGPRTFGVASPGHYARWQVAQPSRGPPDDLQWITVQRFELALASPRSALHSPTLSALATAADQAGQLKCRE